MSQFLFINSDFVIDNTGIDPNIDKDKLLPYIAEAHDVYILPLLGESFYNHIISATSGGTLTTQELDLVKNHIQKTAAKWSYYCALPHMSLKSTNKGTMKQKSEWSDSADLDEFKTLSNSIKDIAELYSTRLTKALKIGYDAGHFPLAHEICGDNPTKSGTDNNYSGLFFPKRNSGPARN